MATATMCGQRVQFCSFLLLGSLLVPGTLAQVTIALIRPSGSNLCGLSCRRGSATVNNPRYFVEIPSSGLGEELDYPIDASDGTIAFELTPQLEGNYFCRHGGQQSATLELVAFPEPIDSIREVTTAIAQSGEPTMFNCEFEIGRLSQRYTFRWIRVRNGITTVLVNSNPPMSVNEGKYQLLGNKSLLIRDSEFTDAEGRYYCDVAVVNIIGTDVFERGRFITLEVYDRAVITQGITKKVIPEDTEVEFACQATGHPLPDIQWFFNGTEISPNMRRFRISVDEMTFAITSTLTISPAVAQDSGMVTCTAVNSPSNQNIVFNRTSSATLTVLTDDIDDLLLTTSMQPHDTIVYIHFVLPARILERVTLAVMFIEDDSEQPQRMELTDPAFSNAMEVHYPIPPEDLPRSLSAFRVKVALSVDGEQGPFTGASNFIRLEDSDCSEDRIVKIIKTAVPTLCGTVILVILTITVGIVSCYRACRVPSHHGGSNHGDSNHGYNEPDFGFSTDKEHKILPWQALLGLGRFDSTNTDSTVVDPLEDTDGIHPEEMQSTQTMATDSRFGNHNGYHPVVRGSDSAPLLGSMNNGTATPVMFRMSHIFTYGSESEIPRMFRGDLGLPQMNAEAGESTA